MLLALHINNRLALDVDNLGRHARRLDHDARRPLPGLARALARRESVQLRLPIISNDLDVRTRVARQRLHLVLLGIVVRVAQVLRFFFLFLLALLGEGAAPLLRRGLRIQTLARLEPPPPHVGEHVGLARPRRLLLLVAQELVGRGERRDAVVVELVPLARPPVLAARDVVAAVGRLSPMEHECAEVVVHARAVLVDFYGRRRLDGVAELLLLPGDAVVDVA
mmetsp:Transcript_8668/g.22351  ORF Transcript_8668/g.22351 Transcript_8668/m.22351 type:complete len:222 (-) Transcript_8668:1091-1756(-)